MYRKSGSEARGVCLNVIVIAAVGNVLVPKNHINHLRYA